MPGPVVQLMTIAQSITQFALKVLAIPRHPATATTIAHPTTQIVAAEAIATRDATQIMTVLVDTHVKIHLV